MSSNRYLLRMTPPTDAPLPVLVQGRPAVEWWAELMPELVRRCGPEAARLFAEPVAPAKQDATSPALSWYTSVPGDARPFPTLDEVGQRVIAARLRESLLALRPLLRDPALGAKLAGALILPSLDDVLIVSGQPILVSWGHLPAVEPRDGVALEAHFVATLGRFAPELAQPDDGAERRPEANQAAPPNAPADAPTARPAAQPPAPEPSPAPEPPAAPEPPRVPPAPHARDVVVRPAWGAPLIASAIAGLVLLVLTIPGVLVYPTAASRSATGPAETTALIEHNRELERRLDQLRDQLAAPSCPASPGAIRSLLPSREAARTVERDPGPAPSPSTARPGSPSPAARQSPTSPSDVSNVPDLLDGATVFVVGLSNSNPAGASVSTGSGFLVSDRHVVTNAHVVAAAAPSAIFIANRAMGPARRGRVVATSWAPVDGPGEDLAIIEIDADAARPFLRVGPMPTRQDEIVAVGFPAFVVAADTHLDLRRIVEGSGEGAPEPQQIRGFVTGTPQLTQRGFQVVTHTAQTAPGSSGGPLADLCGRVVGVNTWLRPNQGGPQVMNIAQTASTLAGFLRANGVAIDRDERSCRPETRRADPGAATPSAR